MLDNVQMHAVSGGQYWPGGFSFSVNSDEVKQWYYHACKNKVQTAAIFAVLGAIAYITQDYWLKPLLEPQIHRVRLENCPICAARDSEEKGGKDTGGMLSEFSKSHARVYKPGEIKVKMKDVAGLENVKEDLQDIMAYLKSPKKFLEMGAKVPKGVLLSGPPGNGKTLIAKAVAGEVECPFISISASEFIEAIVGIGAARIRDLFMKAKELSPCIIFIDEIDAVAKKRSSVSFGGGGDEQAQTLAQLLVMMDGFDSTKNPIIVMAATNRVDVLDPAIMRPGRFDRKIEVSHPYIKDRCKILEIHLQDVKKLEKIDVQKIGRVTRGFSGADLAQLVNDAAILAVNDDAKGVTMKHFDMAYDHMTLGRETKGMDQMDLNLWATAVHEAGHSVARIFLKHTDPLQKVTITPRGNALGVSYSIPLTEKHAYSEDDFKDKIVVCLCGGLAEQEFQQGKNSGVSNDLKTAYQIAYDMVVVYGMGQDLPCISYSDIDRMLPDDIATRVHDQVKKIIDECYERGKKLVTERRDEIQQLAELLMEKGTVQGNEVYRMFGLEEPKIEYSLS
jgi:cell division protease FtsH